MVQGLATEIALIDLNEELVEAEVRDLQNASEFLPQCDIYGGSSKRVTYQVMYRL